MSEGTGPFHVDADKALDTLSQAWGDLYEIWLVDDQWQAWHKDADTKDVLTGSTPDEINRAIRADWLRRQDR